MTEEVVTTPTTETTNAAPAPAPAAPPPAPAAAYSEPKTQPSAPAAPSQPHAPKERTSVLRDAMIAKGIIKPKTEQASPAPTGQQPRDAQGKFASTSSPSTSQASTPASPAAALPRSLRKEYEAHWKAAHPELQKAWSDRDAAYDKGISGYRQRAEFGDAMIAELKPYEGVMRQSGTDARSMIRNLMPVAAVLTSGTPQQKAAVVMSVMQQYGVPVEMLTGQAPQGGQPPAPAMDPTMQAIMGRISQIENAFQSREQTQRTAEDQRIQAIAEAYGRDKPNFDAMRSQMWSLLQAQASAESQGLQGPLGTREDTALWSEQQWIENAYNASLRLDPTHFQTELTRQREEAARAERDKATQAATAARNAAVQVRGAPSGSAVAVAPVDPKDRRAVIATALRSHI